ncbi:MAG: Imm52 family immunity protein [Methylovirgula sp.]|jgi:hypothetical protein
MQASRDLSCYALACWTAREETPDALAYRFLSLIDQLREIDPVLEFWTSGAKGPKKFEVLRDHYADVIKACLSKDDFGEPLPIDGYWFGAITRGQQPSRSFAINVHAGAYKPMAEHQNDLMFTTSRMVDADPSSLTYEIFRPVLRAIVATWAPEDCIVMPRPLLDLIDLDRHFRDPWMQYLSKPFADLITPPEDVLTERFADGGLLMIATTDTFDVDNRNHVAGAHAIGAATAPLEKLPYVYHPKTR